MQLETFSTTYTEAPIINGSANLHYTYNDFKELSLKDKGDFLWFAIVQKGLNEVIPYTEITAQAVENPDLFHKVMRTAAQKESGYVPPVMKLGAVEVRSAAQLMTLAGYDTDLSKRAGIPFCKLRFRTHAEDLEDLTRCTRFIGGYNEFEPAKVSVALNRYLGMKQFYSETNPNNSNDILKFEIGRENSPVIYIKYSAPIFLGRTVKVITDREGARVHVQEFDVDDFLRELKHRVEMFAKVTHASECWATIDERNDVYKFHNVEYRIYWS